MIHDILHVMVCILAALATGMSLVMLFHTSFTGRQRYNIPRHIVPLALSYTTLSASFGVRVYLHQIDDPLLLVLHVLAFLFGIYGLWVALTSRAKAIGG